MPNPVTSRAADPYASYREPDPPERLACEAPQQSSEPAPLDDPRAYLLTPPPADNGSCDVACGVAAAVACGGLGLAAGALLSPTGVGPLAGAVLGVDCSIASTLLCVQLCK